MRLKIIQNGLGYLATCRKDLYEGLPMQKVSLHDVNTTVKQLSEQHDPIAEHLDGLKRCYDKVE